MEDDTFNHINFENYVMLHSTFKMNLLTML